MKITHRWSRVLRAATFLSLVSAGSALHAQSVPVDTLGRSLAATCANCHGTDGAAKGNMAVRLAGMKADALVATMMAYKSGGKTGTIMHQIAKGYTDEQIKSMARYFEAQKAQ